VAYFTALLGQRGGKMGFRETLEYVIMWERLSGDWNTDLNDLSPLEEIDHFDLCREALPGRNLPIRDSSSC
jgi:hypothetical protein